jgi:serine/threonine-protein kinase RsbW
MSQSEVIRLDLPAQHKYLSILGACLTALLERVEEPVAGSHENGSASSLAYSIALAAHEVCTNVVEHAYAGTPNGRIRLMIEWEEASRRLVVDIHDTGLAFDPAQIPAPDLSDGQVHGYGLFLVYQLTHEASYHTTPEGNYWRLVWNL